MKKSEISENFGEISEKVGEISEIIGKSRKFSGKIGQTKFLCIFLFEAHRKTIFRRNIGRKNRNFCPCIQFKHYCTEHMEVNKHFIKKKLDSGFIFTLCFSGRTTGESLD